MKYLTNEILKHRNDLEKLGYKKNQTYYFIPTDSNNLWYYNLENFKNNNSLKYYINNPITYNLNNEGFRTPDDFNSKDWGNVYLGCSHTFGIGHHLENLWAYKLNNILGGKFWNLGIGGTGVTTHFRLLLAYYKELKIKNIFHYVPMYPRYEFIEKGIPKDYVFGSYNDTLISKFGSNYESSLINDEQIEFNWISYTNAIRGLAKEINAKYYLIQGDLGNFGEETDGSLQARDLLHHTTKYHHKIYQDFLKLYDLELFEKYKDIQTPIFNIEQYMKNTKLKML